MNLAEIIKTNLVTDKKFALLTNVSVDSGKAGQSNKFLIVLLIFLFQLTCFSQNNNLQVGESYYIKRDSWAILAFTNSFTSYKLISSKDAEDNSFRKTKQILLGKDSSVVIAYDLTLAEVFTVSEFKELTKHFTKKEIDRMRENLFLNKMSLDKFKLAQSFGYYSSYYLKPEVKTDLTIIVECTQFDGDGHDTQVFINGILVEKSPYLVK